MKLDWKHLFNWEITNVNQPVRSAQFGVQGYMVSVEYKYHGVDEHFFSDEDERMYTTYTNPQVAARECYKSYRRKMLKQAGRAR